MAGPEKLNYTHEAMADAIIQNPGVSQGQLAALFGYSPGWVSQVINSDGFQAFLKTRMSQIVDPMLTASVEERLRGLVVKSIDVLQEKLALDPRADTAAKALEIGTRALGYGAKAGLEVNTTYVVALPPKSPDTRAWLDTVAKTVEGVRLPVQDLVPQK